MPFWPKQAVNNIRCHIPNLINIHMAIKWSRAVPWRWGEYVWVLPLSNFVTPTTDGVWCMRDYKAVILYTARITKQLMSAYSGISSSLARINAVLGLSLTAPVRMTTIWEPQVRLLTMLQTNWNRRILLKQQRYEELREFMLLSYCEYLDWSR